MNVANFLVSFQSFDHPSLDLYIHAYLTDITTKARDCIHGVLSEFFLYIYIHNFSPSYCRNRQANVFVVLWRIKNVKLFYPASFNQDSVHTHTPRRKKQAYHRQLPSICAAQNERDIHPLGTEMRVDFLVFSSIFQIIFVFVLKSLKSLDR